MSRSRNWLVLVSITVLIAVTLLGGIVSALAGNDQLEPAAGQTLMVGGTESAVPGEATSPAGGEAPELAPGGEETSQGAGITAAAEEPAAAPDAGILCSGKIVVTKFLDANENGKKDAGETGMPEVTITVVGKGVNLSKKTGSDGKATFSGLAYGDYTVSETVPPGYHATTDTSFPVKLSWCSETACVFFGNAPNPPRKGSISGHKWLDPNGDGNYGDKAPLGGVTIELWKDGALFATTTTAADGSYSFADLDPGDYTVKEISPAGYVPIPPESIDVAVAEGQDVTCIDFYNKPRVALKGSISGHKWLDPNGDGNYGDKAPLGGVTIELWKDGALFATTTTAADGSYSFADLDPGDYTVKEISPAGYVPTTPESIDVAVAEGQDVTGVDFYNRPRVCQDGIMEAVVRADLNCDGVFGWGELVDGVTIRLYHVESGGGLTPVSPPSKVTGPGSGIWMVWPLPPTYITVDYPAGHVIWDGLPRAYGGLEEATYRIVMETPEGYTAVGPTSYDMVLHNCPWPCFWGWFEFRIARTYHINGHKYEDANCNGVIDEGDAGVPGIEVKLFKWNEGSAAYEYYASDTTDADGYYEFTGLPDGVYKVQEVLTPELLEEWFIVSPAGGVYEGLEVGCGDSYDDLDFLNARYGSISGCKYEDKNCNRVIDEGDAGVPGIEVKLFKWNEGSAEYQYVKSATTGAGGCYEFTQLLPGTYKVQEVLTPELLEEWFIVSPEGGVHEGIPVSCACGVEDKDFLNARYGSLEGWKYWDKNENGIMDEGDEGLAGVTIILTPEDGEPQETVTDENGYFFFGKLLPGKYTVSVDESTAEGYYPVSETSIEVEVLCGKTTKVYFSEAPYGSISGRKWLDADFDGVWGADETKVIAGITINLYAGDPPSELIGTAVTGEDGYYQFTDLKPGKYTVVEVGEEGYFSTTPDSVAVELSAGEGAVVDFGNCPYGRIEGLKFKDLDGDGAQDAGEPPLAGVQITLVGLGDVGTLAVATTGADGTVLFKDLLPGKYAVEEKVPAGFYATRPVKVELAVGPGESVSVVFANALYGSITGGKWMDDGDGSLDAAKDTPKAGVTVKLSGKTKGGAPVSMERTTAADGSFSFLLLEAGSYTVTEVYDAQKMKALRPDSVDIALLPGGTGEAKFLNAEAEVGGEVVTPPPAEEARTLPLTGANQLPLLAAAAGLMLLGLAFIALGLRRRHQE